MGDQEVADDCRATVGTEGHAGLGADGAVQKAGKFGSQGHSSLGVNDSVMGTDQRDPEQGSCLGRQFRRGNHPVMRRLHMPAVGDVAPGNRLTEPIGQHDEREPGDDCEFPLAIFYVLNMSVIDLRKKQRQFMAVAGVGVLRSRRPVPPPALQRLTHAIEWNQGTAGRNKLSRSVGHPEQIEILSRNRHCVLAPAYLGWITDRDQFRVNDL